jgi:hypothetical protein
MKKLSDMEFFKSRKVRIWSAVIAILLFLTGTAFLIVVLSYEMFTANPRFVIRHVRVSSQDHGFWKGRKDLICDILQIREGFTNMFNLDPGRLRQRLLDREPSIQSVRIIRELPDTLYVNLVERTPVALVNSFNSRLVVDSKTILMQKDRCMDIASTLPVIFGIPDVSSYPPGSAVHRYQAAVNLILLTRTSYPDLRIGLISVKNKGQLICSIYYQDDPYFYRVIMPDRELSRNLQVLAATLGEMRKNNNPRRNINLLFRNQVIITGNPKPEPEPPKKKKKR